MTAQRVSDLADSAGDHRLVVLVLAYCGPRWSEMAGLRAANVNLMRRRLDISQAVVEVDVAGSPGTARRITSVAQCPLTSAVEPPEHRQTRRGRDNGDYPRGDWSARLMIACRYALFFLADCVRAVVALLGVVVPASAGAGCGRG